MGRAADIDILEIAAAYRKLKSFKRAGKALGISHSTVAARLRAAEIPTKRYASRVNPAAIAPAHYEITDDDRRRRREHAKKNRDANRRAKRCLNETKHKPHSTPTLRANGKPYSKCEECRTAAKVSQ